MASPKNLRIVRRVFTGGHCDGVVQYVVQERHLGFWWADKTYFCGGTMGYERAEFDTLEGAKSHLRFCIDSSHKDDVVYSGRLS